VSLRPFFSYYGGKWRDALRYPAPMHGTVVEPFAGSAGYALRYPDRRVVLCDADPVVCAVWDYLTRVSPVEVLALPDLPAGGTVADLPISQEARWLVGFWLNRGAAAPRQSASRWMREGERPGSFWGDRVRRTIASQVDAIRHWRVRHCDCREAPVTGPATWFIDPPYRAAGRYYRHGSEDIDFGALGEWCRGLPGQVIVCENEGADWLPFQPLGDTKTTRAGRRSREAVWLSGVAA
jgi:hypothetical protein